MKFKFRAVLLGVAAAISTRAIAEPSSIAGAPVVARAPVNVIFDTDIWGDIDDAMALAMLHALHDRHEVNLIAVTISTDDKWCAPYVDLVDTFYGHPQIPIGIVDGGVTPQKAAYPTLLPKDLKNYTQLLSERKRPDGALVYPHRLVDGTQASEAVSLLRRTLAAQPDQSVVIIQVGFSTNNARLLDSKPDAVSSLGGRDLIQRKVRLLSVMAGNFAEQDSPGKPLKKGVPEFNLMKDVPSAQRVFSDWPTPIVASGFEVGGSILFPAFAIEHHFSYARDHPIAETYRVYSVELNKMTWPHNHPTFDLTSVLYAARPEEDYFSLSKPGRITVLSDGASRFDESETGTHRYLILPVEKRARALEALVMLASQPPAGITTPTRTGCK